MSKKTVLDSEDRPNMIEGDTHIRFGEKTYELSDNDYNSIKILITHRDEGWTEMVPYLIKYFDNKEDIYWQDELFKRHEVNKGNKPNSRRNVADKLNLFNYVDKEMQKSKSEDIRKRQELANLIQKKTEHLTRIEVDEALKSLSGQELSPERHKTIKYKRSNIYDDCDDNCPDPEGNGCCDRVTRILSSIFPTTFRNYTHKKKIYGGKTKSKNKKHNSTRCKNRKNKKSCKNHK